MTLDQPVRIPSFNFNARILEVTAARKPSKSTLKYVRAELRLKNHHEDHVFSPGDLIEGEFVLFKTKENKVIRDIYFNDLEIKFESHFQTALGQDALFFSMEDNPPLESFPEFATNPDKHPFESCSFPFSFTIPHEHLEDTCVNGHLLHRRLAPSYGCPQLCGESFHPTEVAGLKPSNTVSMEKLKSLTWNKFANYYTLTCRVKQNIKGLDRPYVVFARSLEVKVKSDFVPLPTNITQTPLDIASYYNIGDVNSSHELCITKSINLKKLDETANTGSITVSSLLPSPVFPNSRTSFPIDLRYIPSSEQALPTITASVELNQYTVQSTHCIPGQAMYSHLPGNNVPFSVKKSNGSTTLIQKIQTVFSEVSTLNREEWRPDYNDHGCYVKQAEITLPSLVKDDVLQSTFHTCHMQNIYCLDVKLIFDQGEKSVQEETPRKRSFGELLGFATSKDKTAAGAGESAEFGVLMKNTLQLTIPVIVI